MQTLTEQLVEALEGLLRDMHLPCGPYNPDGLGCQRPCGTCQSARSALDRYRADPEALLRENGEAVRRTGNELMAKRDRQWAKTGKAT